MWTAEQAETSLAAKKRRSTMRLTRVDTQNLEGMSDGTFLSLIVLYLSPSLTHARTHARTHSLSLTVIVIVIVIAIIIIIIIIIFYIGVRFSLSSSLLVTIDPFTFLVLQSKSLLSICYIFAEAAQTRGPLSFSAFTDHVAEMRANDSFLLAKEYEVS